MEVGLFDEVKVVRRLIPDEEQLAEIEFNETQIAFANAKAKATNTKEPADAEEAQELEVKLVNLFFAGSSNPVLRRAWAAYRRRLLYHNRAES